MKLYDRGKIIAGIVIFLILITFPFWYGKGKAVAPPELELDTPAIEQLAGKALRGGCRLHAGQPHEASDRLARRASSGKASALYTATDGRVFEMSLTGTCLKCHSNKDQFCDRCHDYVGVEALLLELPYRPRGGPPMTPTRREFLNIAGISAVGGCCARRWPGSWPSRHPNRAAALPAPEGQTLGHGGRCGKMPRRLHGLHHACHHAHNVPDIGNPKDEVNWIWPRAVRSRLSRREPSPPARRVDQKTARPGSLQPLRQPALRAGLPHGGHLPEAGRHRDDGLPPLHRVPVLHGRLPLRGAEHELPRSPALHRARSTRISRRGPRAWWRNAISARSGWQGASSRPVSSPARKRPWCSAMWKIPARRSGCFSTGSFTIRRRAELGTKPQVYYIL